MALSSRGARYFGPSGIRVAPGVSWDVIKDTQKRDLGRRFAKAKLKHLRHIAIDEISIAKGHRYLTVVMDLDSGAVVFVGDCKGAKALLAFWKRLRGSKAKIEAVAMDMSPARRWRHTGAGCWPTTM
jgi:transposase